jgi:4-hydroxythreonine-4-phosphate dehydrogenase
MTKTIAISLGEPAGIGPNILLLAALQARASPWLVYGSRQVLEERAALLQLPVRFESYQADRLASQQAGFLTVVDIPGEKPVQPGILESANSFAVLNGIREAVNACLKQKTAALVTLPVHKGVINQAGIDFLGHTNFLAELSHTPKVVMMLGCDALKVALLTTHIPLKDVPHEVTFTNLHATITIIQNFWLKHYQKAPRILVLGLNPHAGEGGYLGSEEQEVIEPAIKQLQAQGFFLKGPVAADTAFTEKQLAGADVVLAMYHDQGLAPLKAVAFGEVVNYTLGLPFSRTSVDHGVALDLADSKQVNISSFLAAVRAAEQQFF